MAVVNIALITDYDAGVLEGTEAVTAHDVLAVFEKNAERIRKVVLDMIGGSRRTSTRWAAARTSGSPAATATPPGRPTSGSSRRGCGRPMTSPASPAAPRARGPPSAAPTHGCVRCGAVIPIHESMCESCNPLGLKAPAATQAHGTALPGVVVAVVVLAVVARLLVANVGPFTWSAGGAVADPGGLRVTITVTNTGSSAGSTTCRIDDPTRGGISPSAAFVQSPREPGATATFDVVVGGFGKVARELLVDCGS